MLDMAQHNAHNFLFGQTEKGLLLGAFDMPEHFCVHSNAFVSICDHPRMVDWIGRHSLVETIQVLSSMDRVVSHDTGPMHLAQWVSQEKPLTLVALFGPTVPETRLLTSNPRIRSIWGGEHLVCRPCYDGRAFPPCDHVSCMRSIKVDAVVQALDL